jgi:DNA-directed RNA polymerase subunit RPC12/RpoP
MTVKVVETKPDPSVVKHIICRNCGAKLEYVPKDVKEHSYSDYGGGSNVDEYITCPQCRGQVIIRSR